jgi:hypothetical protein
MKKTLILLAGGLLLTVAASASTITLNCNSTTNPTNGNWTIPLFQLACPQFMPPGADLIESVQIFAEDSFNQGQANNAANQVTFYFTNALPNLGFAGNAYNDVVNASCCSDTVGGDYYQFGNTLNGTGWLGAGSVNVAQVTAAGTGGAPASEAQDSVNFFIEYTYGIAPEPMTMVLVGGGLLGVGLLAGKRRKKA